MGIIEIRPDPHGNPERVEIFEDGKFFINCPKNHVQACIDRHLASNHDHFDHIYRRQEQNDPKLVIAVDSRYGLSAYSIGSEGDDPKGFGGDNWIIRFLDGREVRSSSLWAMGQIPSDWLDRIKVNATLVVRNPWHTKEYPL
jgi:hypothetical protein